MLASFPASMLNQKPADLGIPNRFNRNSSRFNTASARRDGPTAREVRMQEAVSKRNIPNGRIVESRRQFIGGSDARVVMGTDEEALIRLWREKRGEVEPED